MQLPMDEPASRFVPCAWYEAVNHIRLTEPKRFASFSSVTVECLRIYLDMKERHAALKKAA